MVQRVAQGQAGRGRTRRRVVRAASPTGAERDAAGAIVTFIEGLAKVKEAGGSTFQVLE
ncbi:MAG: hypothetical protein IIA90_09445, partial [Chloroflexi bacterium]|nr:hypothetical protein [Chloroflexota bacterium]